MASNAGKLLCLVFFFALVTRGYGECTLSDLIVQQSKTGKMVQNKPEWEVRATNTCDRCKFRFIDMSCVGFKSVTPIDSSLMLNSGDSCFLYAHKFIIPHKVVVFKYVWDTNFDFKVLSGEIICY